MSCSRANGGGRGASLNTCGNRRKGRWPKKKTPASPSATRISSVAIPLKNRLPSRRVPSRKRLLLRERPAAATGSCARCSAAVWQHQGEFKLPGSCGSLSELFYPHSIVGRTGQCEPGVSCLTLDGGEPD